MSSLSGLVEILAILAPIKSSIARMYILNTREKEILTSRRLSDEIITLEDLSKKYKVSRERIRQIETRAFEKLQKAILNAAKSNNLLPKN